MKKYIRKIFAALIVILFASVLTGCSGDDDKTGTAAQNLKTYQGTDFTIKIDPVWKVISRSDFYSEIPKETVMAFAAPEAWNGFFMNINIVMEDLKQKYTSVDFGRANINNAQSLTDYQKIQEAKVTVGGQPALLHIFQARLNPSEKLIRFIQLYATNGNYGYIVSGGMLPDTPKTMRDLIGSMVMSFSFGSTSAASGS